MRLFFYGRYHTSIPEELLTWSLGVLDKADYTWAVNKEYARGIFDKFGVVIPARNRYSRISPEDVDADMIMISMGGDGTLLEAVYTLRGLPVPIVGLNLGNLGFLANIPFENAKSAFFDVLARRFSIEERTMLTVEGDFGGPAPDFPSALNEFTLHRHTADTIETACWIDGYKIPNTRGDGAIVSTPTGSTAYSFSAGGPVVTPECRCFIVGAIAPHNISLRPLVIPDTSTIILEVRSRGREALVTLDNRSFVVGDGARFTIKKSEFSVFLMQPKNISFYTTFIDKMMRGLDKRDEI